MAMKLNDNDANVSPIYQDIESLKQWIEKRYNVQIIRQGPNFRGWPSFVLSDNHILEYEDIRFSGNGRLLRNTQYQSWCNPRECPKGFEYYLQA